MITNIGIAVESTKSENLLLKSPKLRFRVNLGDFSDMYYNKINTIKNHEVNRYCGRSESFEIFCFAVT